MKYDVIVIGGGYNGLSFAGMLANAGVSVCLIERGSLNKKKAEPSRLLAIAMASCEIYKKHQLLKDLGKLGQSINHIRVVDNDSHAFVDFDPQEAGFKNFGYMIEEQDLGNALYTKLKAHPKAKIIEGSGYDSIDINAHRVVVKVDGQALEAKLLVAVDGKASTIRALSGIDYVKHTYGQVAVICDVGHELDHSGVAVEKFTPTGPFAILPKTGGHSSSIVWTLPRTHADTLRKLDESAVMELLEERFDGYLGALNLQSSLCFFNLDLIYARKYYDKRVALLGDALHAIHPLAGQGLNLSLRDADALAGLIVKRTELGLDIGSEMLLKEYQSLREADNLLMIEGTDGLNWLFSNEFIPLKFLRRLGLRIVNKTPFLKKAFMRYASTGNYKTSL